MISPLIFSKRSRGEEGSCPKWGSSRRLRVHHGTYEEDGLVTWEALVFPRVIRSDGEPVIHLRNWRVRGRTRWPPSLLGRISACPEVGRWQGELEPRPKEARESEGLI
jgi:hypothetical protein